MRITALAVSFLTLIPAGCASTASASIDATEAAVRISTAGDLPVEHEAVAQLQRLFEQYDLGRWINTKEVIIHSRAIPHSHPVLTLNTRYAEGDDLSAMSTFVHEQGHWYFTAHDAATNAAIAELDTLFPQTPTFEEGGARDHRSTLLHLMVCTLEYDAMVALVGTELARKSIASRDIYPWVYARILDAGDSGRIRAVMQSHGLSTY